MYRCEATSVGGFVQQLAVQYVTHGYWFYVMGQIPESKDPQAVDAKLIERYRIDSSSAERSRRKAAGWANVQYLRLGQEFILVATHGAGRFFEEERFRDARRAPIQFRGYSISHRNGRTCVRIHRDEYVRLKAHFVELATRRSQSAIASMFAGLPFEPYAPIRDQLFRLLRAVNRARKSAGMPPVPVEVLRLRRRIYRPFDPEHLQPWSNRERTEVA